MKYVKYCNLVISNKCYSAYVPLDFCTTADFMIKDFFFNEDTAGVNIPQVVEVIL